MKKSYYYEFAIVVIVSLLIIFSTFIIEKSLEKYQLLKSAATNGTLIVIQQGSNYSDVSNELRSLEQLVQELYISVRALNAKIDNLSQQVQQISRIQPVQKTIIVKQIYNYTYSYQLDERKLDLLLQYVESHCYTGSCRTIDELLYQLSQKESLFQAYPELAAKLKSDLLVLKHFAADRDYDNKDMLLLALNNTAIIASFLDSQPSSEAKIYAAKLYQIIANLCKSYDKVISCAYVIYLPGQKINTSQYDLVVRFNLENLDKSLYLQYLVEKYNVTTTPYYINF